MGYLPFAVSRAYAFAGERINCSPEWAGAGPRAFLRRVGRRRATTRPVVADIVLRNVVHVHHRRLDVDVAHERLLRGERLDSTPASATPTARRLRGPAHASVTTRSPASRPAWTVQTNTNS